MKRAPGDATRRLFVALMADAPTRAALDAQRRAWAWPDGTRLPPPEHLHLTLHFLGDVESAAQAAVQAELALEPADELPLALRTLRLWHGGIAVLCPDEHAGLRELHARLAQALRRAGLTPDPGPWKPHVTLARHASALPPDASAAIGWTARRFALVWSQRPGGYEVLAEYPA